MSCAVRTLANVTPEPPITGGEGVAVHVRQDNELVSRCSALRARVGSPGNAGQSGTEAASR
mgnify:CR=1 FL=1